MKKILLIATTLLFSMPSGASAVSIRNIDAEASYKITVTDGGEVHEVTIPPYGVYRTAGPFVTISIKGQKPLKSDGALAEFMIKNGKLSLQKSDNSQRGR